MFKDQWHPNAKHLVKHLTATMTHRFQIYNFHTFIHSKVSENGLKIFVN